MGSLGEKLRHIRNLRGATLKDVEGATGVSHSYLSKLETGVFENPSREKLGRLARYYGVSVAELFTEDPMPDGLRQDLGRIKGLLEEDNDTENPALNEVFAHAVKALEIAIETEKRGAPLTPRQKKAILRLVLEFTEPSGGV